MLSNLKESYAKLKPEHKQKLKIAGIVGVVVGFGMMVYGFTSSSKTAVNVSAGPATSALNVDNKILEKTVTAQNDQKNKELDDLQKKVAALQGTAPGQPGATQGIPVGAPVTAIAATPGVQQLDKLISQRTQRSVAPATQQVAMQSPAPAPRQRQKQLPPLPQPFNSPPLGMQFTPPPPPANDSGSYYQVRHASATADHSASQMTAKIGVASIKAPETVKATGDDAGKKKEKRAVYLPPSFMAATLLSGLNAPTSDAGKGNPVPVIIRVAAPAQLPNEVRANLKGCFVIGEAVGSLSDERAHTRLVSISCVSKRGQAVIDQKIVGFVQDADGGIGLTGRVVSKMGAAVARLAAVGVLQGMGNAFNQSVTQTSVSPFGQVSTLGTSMKDMGISAAGNGIANASKGLAKIYEDLTLGSLPVIEVANGKKITLVVTEGVNLEIKNYKTVPWY